MPDSNYWGSFPFLQVLRPEPGETVDGAVLATYSADLVVVAAALLALAGLDDDRGSGSKVDLANSFERLRGRFCVLCQRGRILAPLRTALVLNLMDRFVHEVGADERQLAWHPKVALVRYRGEGGVKWRLWIGSRNLTKSMAWEFGALMVSDPNGKFIEGVAELGGALARRAALSGWEPSRIQRELEQTRWQCPRGFRIEDVRLWETNQTRNFPDPPPGVRKLVVVGPYLDGSLIGRLGQWGENGTNRTLVSTLSELKKLASQVSDPLAGFRKDLRYLDSPDEEQDAHASLTADGGDEEPDSRGLHAKLIYAEHSGGRTLWLGSANITQRAWMGSNAEVIAKAAVDADVGRGLDAFLDGETCEVSADLLTSPAVDDAEQEVLDEVRRTLSASWNLRQEIRSDVTWLHGDYDPHDKAAQVEVKVGRLGDPPQDWPWGANRVSLAIAPMARSTELVLVHLRLGDRQCRWVQFAPISNFDRETRDRELMAQYLDVRTFLSWIRSLLDDSIAGVGGGDWDDTPAKSGRGNCSKRDFDLWAPSLEQALKAWVRDPGQLVEADRVLSNYLESRCEASENEPTPEEKRALEAIRKVWPVIRRELLSAANHTRTADSQ